MKEKLEQLIKDWIGEPVYMDFVAKDVTPDILRNAEPDGVIRMESVDNFANISHAMTLNMLRDKAPELAQSIVDMMVEKVNRVDLICHDKTINKDVVGFYQDCVDETKRKLIDSLKQY